MDHTLFFCERFLEDREALNKACRITTSLNNIAALIEDEKTRVHVLAYLDRVMRQKIKYEREQEEISNIAEN